MDNVIPVWDHVRDVFLFWLVWKLLDLVWLHTNCDAKLTNFLAHAKKLVRKLETMAI